MPCNRIIAGCAGSGTIKPRVAKWKISGRTEVMRCSYVAAASRWVRGSYLSINRFNWTSSLQEQYLNFACTAGCDIYGGNLKNSVNLVAASWHTKQLLH